MKRCPHCNLTQTDENSYRRKESNRFQSLCIKCHSNYMKDHYRNNIDTYKIKARKSNKKQQIIARTFLEEAKNKPCMDCGASYPAWVMDFDHREKENKINNVGSLARDSFKMKRLKEEIDKCDLVCANCHRLRTYNRYLECKGRVAQCKEHFPTKEQVES